MSKQSYTNTSERFVSHGHVGSFTLVTPSGVHNEGTLEEEEKSGHKVAATFLYDALAHTPISKDRTNCTGSPCPNGFGVLW